jgi:hypothetical protein
MKTSNKILVWTLLIILGTIVGAQIALYARYKGGDILTSAEIYRQNHVRRELPAPAHLVVRGVYEVHFLRAGQFAIEFEKEGIQKGDFIEPVPGIRSKHREEGEMIIQPRYHRSGDTLIINGYDPQDTAHIPLNEGNVTVVSPHPGARMLNIFGYTGGDIQMEGGSTHIEGDSVGEGHDFRIMLKQNTLSLVKNGMGDTAIISQHFRNLTINATDHSEFELGPGTFVRDLSLDLDSTSVLTENGGWSVGQMHLRVDDRSALQINGQLLKKVQGQPTPASR